MFHWLKLCLAFVCSLSGLAALIFIGVTFYKSPSDVKHIFSDNIAYFVFSIALFSLIAGVIGIMVIVKRKDRVLSTRLLSHILFLPLIWFSLIIARGLLSEENLNFDWHDGGIWLAIIVLLAYLGIYLRLRKS